MPTEEAARAMREYARTEIHDQLRRLAKERVERVLSGLFATFGPLDREELGAILDGAQDATMNWLPKRKGE